MEDDVIERVKLPDPREANCQFCDSPKTNYYVPYGYLCDTCKKNLRIIRKYKLGIPNMKRKGGNHE